MPQSAPIDFWFSIGSLYTYLTIMRIDRVEDLHDVTFNWRPFNVQAIMQDAGNTPARVPAKVEHIWRDLERRSSMYMCDFPARPPYPLQNFERANRIAVVATREGWCDHYARATYGVWFGEGHESGSEPNVSLSLMEVGQDPARVLALADSPQIGESFEAATNEARRLGIFGAPTFVTGGELFWGDDRLEDAVRWHKLGTLKLR
jgi:2-hydroxychromene-2-carboxylate isomerase